ncbi:MAG: methylamine utilization protein [Casimicrobiaceae bacterium]|nr:methylamine utilization protein [Casimicrobiaceae bacterium]MDW8313244.1 methylamine utilization protein [Burkholderiales bacterium]
MKNAAWVLSAALASSGVTAGTFSGIAFDRDGVPLANVVFTLKPRDGRVPPAQAPTTATVYQEDLAFKPYVTVVRRGSSVTFPNRDRVEHHVKSFSASRPFEIPVHRPGVTPEPIRFDQEGAVAVYCILHDWMRAYVYVTDTPWFALSAELGAVRIDNVPAGDYIVEAWHPDLGQFRPPLRAEVSIPAVGMAAQTRFHFDFKPRTPRQPRPGAINPSGVQHGQRN